MRAYGFAKLLEQAINEVNAKHGVTEKVEVVPCEVVQICANGRHKDVVTGKFTK